MKEEDLIELVAQELFEAAISDLKHWMHYAGVEINWITYGEVNDLRKDMLRSKAVKIIAIVRRGS